ncbi:synaptobrevin-A-like isoform X2 [Ptychodera flava]|uniref:synaptobrevin-A-like isoform X2 n=1 Tax=Ptychodera flava TaxID=63121 RepID=UPI00396A2641
MAARTAGNSSYNQNQTHTIQLLQDEVDEVTDIVKENLNKILDRGENIEKLEIMSENLETSALQFKKTTARVKRTLFCKSVKMYCMFIIIGISIALVVVLIVVFVIKPW